MRQSSPKGGRLRRWAQSLTTGDDRAFLIGVVTLSGLFLISSLAVVLFILFGGRGGGDDAASQVNVMGVAQVAQAASPTPDVLFTETPTATATLVATATATVTETPVPFPTAEAPTSEALTPTPTTASNRPPAADLTATAEAMVEPTAETFDTGGDDSFGTGGPVDVDVLPQTGIGFGLDDEFLLVAAGAVVMLSTVFVARRMRKKKR